MKIAPPLVLVGCALMLAAVCGCQKKPSEEDLLTNFNCYYYVDPLTEKLPDFAKKCEEKKLGKYSQDYIDYHKSIWSDGKRAKELAAKMEAWKDEPNKLTQEMYDSL